MEILRTTTSELKVQKLNVKGIMQMKRNMIEQIPVKNLLTKQIRKIIKIETHLFLFYILQQ